jgi:hypothetical protein
MSVVVASELKSPSRRHLLKIGVAGAVVLAIVPLFIGRENKAVAPGFKYLRASDLELWNALVPAFLAGSLPDDPATRAPLLAEILVRIDMSIALLRPSLRSATMDLLDFVETKAPRGLSGGYWGSWADATPEQSTAVLESWSTSSIALLRDCYRVLHDVATGAWYAMPQSWSVVGYPGPPKIAGVNA